MSDFSITLYWVCWSKDGTHCVVKAGPFIDYDEASDKAAALNVEHELTAPPYRNYDHYHVYDSETPVTRF